MADIRAIETEYNGYRFRSRLEARWAVFFDEAGIKYQYELEGYELPNGTRYLPDFFLPDFDTYVEVKGDREGAWDDIRRAMKMIVWGGPIKRILILSDIPTNFDGGMWHFPCLYWDGASDQVWVGWWFFYDDYEEDGKCRGHISSAEYFPPWTIWEDGRISSFKRAPSFQAMSDTLLRMEMQGARAFLDANNRHGELDEVAKQQNYDFNRTTFEAFNSARQARFEYGQTPRVRR